ncbi:uncharacterized protein RHOBADRAFT_66159, partial [Rhodotorula graminis WP1]
ARARARPGRWSRRAAAASRLGRRDADLAADLARDPRRRRRSLDGRAGQGDGVEPRRHERQHRRRRAQQLGLVDDVVVRDGHQLVVVARARHAGHRHAAVVDPALARLWHGRARRRALPAAAAVVGLGQQGRIPSRLGSVVDRVGRRVERVPHPPSQEHARPRPAGVPDPHVAVGVRRELDAAQPDDPRERHGLVVAEPRAGERSRQASTSRVDDHLGPVLEQEAHALEPVARRVGRLLRWQRPEFVEPAPAPESHLDQQRQQQPGDVSAELARLAADDARASSSRELASASSSSRRLVHHLRVQ